MKKITRVWESRKGEHSFEYENIEIYDNEGRIRCRASLLDEEVWSPYNLECGQGYDDFVLDRMPGDKTDRCFVGPVHTFDYREESDGTTTQIESSWNTSTGEEIKIERRTNSLGQVIRESDGWVWKSFEYDPEGRLIHQTVLNRSGVVVEDSTYGYRQEQILSSGVPLRAEVTDIQRKNADGTNTALTLITAYTLSDELAWKRMEEIPAGSHKRISVTEYTFWGENFEYGWEECYEGYGSPNSFGMRQYSKVEEIED